jgi:hypothetical protein
MFSESENERTKIYISETEDATLGYFDEVCTNVGNIVLIGTCHSC